MKEDVSQARPDYTAENQDICQWKQTVEIISLDLSHFVNVEDAKKALEGSIESLEKQYQELSAEYEKLVTYVSRLNAEFQDLAAKIQGQE